VRVRRVNGVLAIVQMARGTAWLSAGRYADAYAALAPMFVPCKSSLHQRERFAGIMPFVQAAVRTDHCQEAKVVVAELEADVIIGAAEIALGGIGAGIWAGLQNGTHTT
jgi:hypothetical protein